MTISHMLQDFGDGEDRNTISISAMSLEDERLEAFEKGYKAGWEDALKAQDGDRSRISADFAANLQDLSFTHREAQTGLIAGLRPLLTGMVETVLPRMAHATLGARVVEMLLDHAQKTCDGPARIVTSPANVEALEALIESQDGIDVIVTSEPSLGDGQVHIQVGQSEAEIDLGAVLHEIEEAVAGFFQSTENTPTAPQKETA